MILQRRDHGLGATADCRLTRTERRAAVAPQPLIGGEPVGASDRCVDRGRDIDAAVDFDALEALSYASQSIRNARVGVGLAPDPAGKYRTAVLVAGHANRATRVPDFRAAVGAIVRNDLELE